MLCLILILFGLSFLVVYSGATTSSSAVIERHAIRLALALGVLFLFCHLPARVLQNWSLWLYILSLVLLVLVLVVGDKAKGGQRWLNLGFMKFQPTELMKISVPIMCASFLHNCILPPRLKLLLVPLAIIVIPFVLTVLQPDLGTAILIASSGIFVIFFAGIKWKYILICLSAAILSSPIMWMSLRGYQKTRILTLLNPERDPFGSGYQIIQSKIAIGSGGLYGKGWLQGTQSNLEFLPERTTDFIFAVFSEEFGLLGVLFLFTIYSLIILRGIYISIQAQDTFTRLLAGSIIMTFFVYVFVNIGMVIGILPVVGIPLPLISYGGTSLITLMVSFGILMSIKSTRPLVRK